MRRESEALPIVLVAAVLLGLGLTDVHLLYVKPAMRPWLIAAGAFVAVLAVARYLVVPDEEDEPDEADNIGDPESAAGDLGDHAADGRDGHGADDHSAHDDHDHAGHVGGWLPWMLVLPFAVVVLVSPKPLGSYLAARQTPNVPAPSSSSGIDYAPLPRAVDGAHELTLTEFAERTLYDTERHLEGKTVRLTGFVTPAPDGQPGFLLTRFVMACCAGDGRAVQVAVWRPGNGGAGGTAGVPPADTWLEVEGTWRPDPSGDEPDVPVLVARSVRQVSQPSDPYER